MRQTESGVSRRGFLRRFGTATASLGAVANIGTFQASADDVRTGTVQLDEQLFRGFVGAGEQIAPFETRGFVVPDLSITPHAIESVTAEGIAVGPRNTGGSLRTDTTPTDGSGETLAVRFTVPEADPADYDGEILRYRVNGTLNWELPEYPTGPQPVRLEYTLVHEPSGSVVAMSDNCRPMQPTHSGADAYDRLFNRVLPGDSYRLEVDASRGGAEWTLDADIEVVTDTARPGYGNDNTEFESKKTTSMDEVAGYGVDTRFGSVGAWDNDTVVTLRGGDGYSHETSGCSSPETFGGGRFASVGPGDDFYSSVPSGMLEYTTRASGTVVEWYIVAEICKEVYIR